jgi:flagellar biosynthesis regulator FlaF
MADKQGVVDGDQLSSHEEAAFALSKAAVMLDQARDEQGKLAAALDNNMEVWVAIKTLVGQSDVRLPDETRGNLVKLCQFVTQTTMAQGVEMPSEVIDTLININLQISEGLLEAQAKGA